MKTTSLSLLLMLLWVSQVMAQQTPRYTDSVHRFSFELPRNWSVADRLSTSYTTEESATLMRPVLHIDGIVPNLNAPGKLMEITSEDRYLSGEDKTKYTNYTADAIQKRTINGKEFLVYTSHFTDYRKEKIQQVNYFVQNACGNYCYGYVFRIEFDEARATQVQADIEAFEKSLQMW